MVKTVTYLCVDCFLFGQLGLNLKTMINLLDLKDNELSMNSRQYLCN